MWRSIFIFFCKKIITVTRFFFGYFFLWLIKPDERILDHFSYIEHVLVWNLNKSDCCQISLFSTIALQISILYYFYHLESEKWKAKNFLFWLVPRHIWTVKVNLSWRRILVGQVNFENKNFLILSKLFPLRIDRETHSNIFTFGTGLESCPTSNRVSGISISVIEFT